MRLDGLRRGSGLVELVRLASNRGGQSPRLSKAEDVTTVETLLPSGFSAPTVARAFVENAFRTWHLDGSQEFRDVSVLLATELVSNVIVHVGGAPTLRLVRSARSLRVEVDDMSQAAPRLEEPDDATEHGRGLLLVARMADKWGYALHDGGKTVWFELRLGDVPGEVHPNGSS
jgi:hypothetical protein